MRGAHRFVVAGVFVAMVLGILSLGAGASSASPAQADDEREIAVRVFDRKGTRERDDDVPVEGAEILVTDAAGEEVDAVVTDEEGAATITVPGEGQYTATLVLESLDEDVGLPRVGGEVLTIDPNRSRLVNFVLGDRQRAERSRLDEAAQSAFDGLKFGLIIATASVGLSLIFGTTGLTNFAHGEIVSFGAIVTWFLVNDHGVNLILGAAVAMAIAGVVGGGLDRVLWRPLRKRGMSLIAMMVVSIGLAFLVRNFFQVWFGASSRPYAQYSVGRTATYEVLGVGMSSTTIATIIIGLLVVITVGVLLQTTRMGKAVRAVADNPDLAASSGINVDRVIAVVWASGSALAALGGVLQGLAEEVRFETGADLLLLMFAAIVVGGLGSAYGALVGGIAVGMVVQLSTLWVTPNLKTASGLALLIVILLVRPQGILGRAERIG